LYCFVRKDLPHPQQVVQASHACIEATKAFLNDNLEHPHLVVLGVKDENQLKKSAHKLDLAGIQYRLFIEPDRNGEATALTTEVITSDEQRHLFRNYQLLKGVA
jgi:hypothetical protein